MEAILYRWWDADGRLLYVGKSVSLFARIAAHRKNSGFFDEAATMTLERFDSVLALSRAEVHAIRTEHPLYNVQHSIDGGGDKTRTITVLDGPVDGAGDGGIGRWIRATIDEIHYGDIIRALHPGGDVEVQGLVDDDWSPLDDGVEPELGDGWFILTDEGTEEVLLHALADGVLRLEQWVSVDPDDPLRRGIMSAYFANFT